MAVSQIPPGADPHHPAYGRGHGSAAAEGQSAFDVPPEPQRAVVAGNPDFTRRQRRSNRQELGFTPEAEAGYPALDTGDMAAQPARP